MSERDQFENKKVFLWGIKQASKALLKEFDKGDQHPSRRRRINPQGVQQPIGQPQRQPKKPREFTLGEDYGVQDLEFLNNEYERIDKELAEAEDMDEMTRLEDLQERLFDLIEGLENMQRMLGKSINIDKPSFKPINKQLYTIKEEVKKPKGTGFKKGTPEAIAQAEKMRKALEAKKGEKPVKEVKAKIESKARVQKGSEEAKALGRRLAEAKKAKMEALKKEKEAEEVKKPKKTKGKPYYYIGDIPDGYREATMQEAIKNNKVSEYGKYTVDKEMLRYFTDYNILLDPEADEGQIRIMLSVLKKKTLRALEDVEIFGTKIENPKYADRLNEFTNKLEEAKLNRKTYNAMYNFYWKLWCNLKGLKYERVKFKLPEKKILISSNKPKIEYKPIERTAPIDPRTGKPALIRTVEEITKGIYKDEDDDDDNEYHFIRDDNIEISLNKKYFDDDKTLKTKYTKKLFEKKIVLEEKFYKDSDKKKYFYQAKGNGIFKKIN